MAQSFSAQVGDWARRVEGAVEIVFKESAQEVARQLQAQLTDMVYDQPVSPSGYQRTGFLRASFVATKNAMPIAARDNPGGQFTVQAGQVELVIMGAEIGEVIYMGYTANYGAYVHYGARGNPPRPWVDMVAQRWTAIVADKVIEVRSRLGI